MNTIDNINKTLSQLAIYYHPEAYTVSTTSRIMGRQSAGEGFLHGLFRHSGLDTFYCYSETETAFKHFDRQLQNTVTGKSARWIPCASPAGLNEAGNLFISGPDIGIHAQRRCNSGPRTFSLTGITHTVCSELAMRAITDLCTTPVEPWDALICTSSAVKSVVENLLQVRETFINSRFAPQKRWVRPLLPVIPLGVDCDRFVPSAASRQKVRQQHGIADNQVAVLYFGRLSFHAKAHPLPMFVALEQAAIQTGTNPVLILAGWTANDAIMKAFVETARQLCPSVRVLIMDARNPAVSTTVWSAADIFCSLSDNIQESFGLTPVEAQAAGLPVIVSDWDGYRDTVEEGITGFRIPTTAPGPGNGEELIWRYLSGQDNYDQFIGNASQSVSVDSEATVQAFKNLIVNSELRATMKMAAMKRARKIYDWPVIIASYCQLWTELAGIRNRQTGTDGGTSGFELPDPFSVFSTYPTSQLLPDTMLFPGNGNPSARLVEYTRLEINILGRNVMADKSVYTRLIETVIKQGHLSVRQLLDGSAEEDHHRLIRTIGWLLKMGILRAGVKATSSEA